MASIAAIVGMSSGNGPDSPCRNALPLERRLPAAVFGPVLRLALARFAAICRSVAMGDKRHQEDEDLLRGLTSRSTGRLSLARSRGCDLALAVARFSFALSRFRRS